MTTMKPEKLLTPRQAADILGFTPRTIARWCRDGAFLGAVKIGRVWRIPEKEIRQVISK